MIVSKLTRRFHSQLPPKHWTQKAWKEKNKSQSWENTTLKTLKCLSWSKMDRKSYTKSNFCTENKKTNWPLTRWPNFYFSEALPGMGGGGGGGSHIARLNFKTSRVGVYKCFMPLSEIGRKLLAFVGILEKGDSDAL